MSENKRTLIGTRLPDCMMPDGGDPCGGSYGPASSQGEEGSR